MNDSLQLRQAKLSVARYVSALAIVKNSQLGALEYIEAHRGWSDELRLKHSLIA